MSKFLIILSVIIILIMAFLDSKPKTGWFGVPDFDDNVLTVICIEEELY